MAVSHFFVDIDALVNPEQHACKHHKAYCCVEASNDVDIGIYGFPCKPFAILSQAAYMRVPAEKLADPQAQPFLTLSRYFRERQPVKVVILENVDGVQH
eukprot:1625504-Pyramimonas_sp.AAC.1